MSQHAHFRGKDFGDSLLGDCRKDQTDMGPTKTGFNSINDYLERPIEAVDYNDVDAQMDVDMYGLEEDKQDLTNDGSKTSSDNHNVTLYQASTGLSSSVDTIGQREQEYQTAQTYIDPKLAEDVVEEGCFPNRGLRRAETMRCLINKLHSTNNLLKKQLLKKNKMILDQDGEIKVLRLELEELRDFFKKMEDRPK